MVEWELVTLGSLGADVPAAFATGPFGSAVSAKNFSASGVPMLRGSNLSEDVSIRLDDSDMVFVPEDLALRFRRSLVGPDDLVFTCWGTIGQLGIIDDRAHFTRYLVSNKQMKMTPDRSRVVPLFLYYYLSQSHMVETVRSRAIGSSVPGFNLGQLKGIHVQLPPLGVQGAIVGVLGALDDKIAANEQTVRMAELLARAEYESGASRGSGITIGAVAEMVTRGVAPRYVDQDGLVVLNQKCVRDQRVSLEPARLTEYSVAKPDRLLQVNDILVNSTGYGTLGRTARWVRDLKATVDSHVTIIRACPEKADPVCAGYGVLEIEDEIELLAEGSTGQTELRRELLSQLSIRLPATSEQERLGQRLAAMDALALALQLESDALARTRDELLPLLMSGKVRVRDAEKLVEEVV